DVHFLHAGLAAAYKATKSFAEAEAHYRRAVTLKPDLAQAHHNLGMLLRERGRPHEAMACFATATRLKRAAPFFDAAAAADHDGSTSFTMTSKTKLEHDIEQLRHLRQRDVLPPSFDATIAQFELALGDVERQQPTEQIVPLPPARRDALKAVYNRLLHVPPAPALSASPLSAALDVAAIEADYRAHAPGITWFDGFLTAEALASLRRFCLEATIWFGLKRSGGYLGAYMEEGFCCDLLLQIADDLRRRLPGIFGDHPLLQLWAYKYDSRLSGIGMHADFAAVNVNFWITPDEASLDPAGGGLEVYDCEAPAEWDFTDYNANPGRIREFLAARQARRIVIPHRQNRVVVFNSNLFHETGAFRFKPGYENRRINITMLFGERQRPA
ncbi:MAG TPA: tetratricopeptide repeat protein, partial [Candidatus Sulfotelmatobacter sp.]|nr:tetratricopeptide repeat protein [Candidatus Sulfotelmatobacter sp.]